MTPYQRLDKRIKQLEWQLHFTTRVILITPLLIAVLFLYTTYAHIR